MRRFRCGFPAGSRWFPGCGGSRVTLSHTVLLGIPSVFISHLQISANHCCSWLRQDKSTFLWTLLPHISRSLADARLEAPELLEIIEWEVDAQQVYHRDRHLDRTLRQMPLSARLACIVARETNLQSLLQEQITQLRQRLP